MAFTSGVATDYIHLADRLRKWLTNIDQVESTGYVGTGDGTMTGQSLGASSVSETFTIVCTVAALNGGTFSVTGSVSGALPNATVGVPYVNAAINFTINDGATDFIVGDTFTVVTFVSNITSPWTQLAWTPGDVNNGGMNLSLRAPGAATDKQVFVNIRSQHDNSAIVYGWDMRTAISYDAGLTFGNQNGESSFTWLALWKSTINYWFYANDRRVIIVVKCNTVYLSAYLGFFLPWATPAEYPFPLFCAGSDGLMRAYNNTNTAHRMFCDPSGYRINGGGSELPGGDWGGGKFRQQNGNWIRALNHDAGTANDSHLGDTVSLEGFIWPYSGTGTGYAASLSTGLNYWSTLATNVTTDNGTIDNLVATAQSERLMLPVLIMPRTGPGGYGALDGVYFPMGQGLTPEQVATLGTRNFRMFPNVHRTSGNDFFAIEEI